MFFSSNVYTQETPTLQVVIHVRLEPSRRINSIKFSRTISRINDIDPDDGDTVSETLVFNGTLTQLIARENSVA
jgi:hypothetical protein